MAVGLLLSAAAAAEQTRSEPADDAPSSRLESGRDGESEPPKELRPAHALPNRKP